MVVLSTLPLSERDFDQPGIAIHGSLQFSVFHINRTVRPPCQGVGKDSLYESREWWVQSTPTSVADLNYPRPYFFLCEFLNLSSMGTFQPSYGGIRGGASRENTPYRKRCFEFYATLMPSEYIPASVPQTWPSILSRQTGRPEICPQRVP